MLNYQRVTEAEQDVAEDINDWAPSRWTPLGKPVTWVLCHPDKLNGTLRTHQSLAFDAGHLALSENRAPGIPTEYHHVQFHGVNPTGFCGQKKNPPCLRETDLCAFWLTEDTESILEKMFAKRKEWKEKLQDSDCPTAPRGSSRHAAEMGQWGYEWFYEWGYHIMQNHAKSNYVVTAFELLMGIWTLPMGVDCMLIDVDCFWGIQPS